MLGKRRKGQAADAVHMPVGIDKVHPLLRSIASCRTVEESIGAGRGLLKETDEIVLHRSFELCVISELPVHGFELAS